MRPRQVRFLGTSSDKCARQAWRRAVQELGDLRWKEAKAALDAARETVLRQYDVRFPQLFDDSDTSWG